MSDDEKTQVGKRTSQPSLSQLDEHPTQENPVASSTMEPAASGRVSLVNERLAEDVAREILHRRFTQYGASIQTDYPFHTERIACTLDGYDPHRRLGYAYISHADADVVTDIDADTELGLHQLAMNGEAWILVVHDSHIRKLEELVVHADNFLRTVPR